MLVTARQANLFAWLELACGVALAAMLVSAWLMVTRSGASGAMLPSGRAAAVLVGTLLPALGLIVLMGRRIAIRRAGGHSARLHVRLVFFFSLVAAVPTLLVTVFASILFQSGVEFWYSDQQRGILENANQLAHGYYEENQQNLGAETTAMAIDVRALLQDAPITSAFFREQYSLQVYSRNLSESAILQQAADGSFRVAAIADPEDDPNRDRISRDMLDQLRSGAPVVVRNTPTRFEAVTPIDAQAGVYLYNARNLSPQALERAQKAQTVVLAYRVLTERGRVLQIRFHLALFAMSLALVTLAVWFALRFADRQVRPLADLVTAAREVGAGNYALRVKGRTGTDEVGLLNRAFNRMTEQIERQTDALIGANRQLAERRAFMEAVLQSSSAGIVSIDDAGQVMLMNASAQELLLDRAGPAPVGITLEEIAPQFGTLLRSGARTGLVQHSRGGELLTLAAKLAPAAEGHVITFDDITRQLLDQRQAAWSDVARRIAHEIKNPLTPIQLATERLKRRYRAQIVEDAELFEELTGTIIRQVGELRTMVDEFSSFARMPKPVFRQEDVLDLTRQALFLQEVAHPEIDYAFATPDEVPPMACDRHQFGQAMTNVLKNAAEATEARRHDAERDYRGRIAVALAVDAEYLTIAVTDNGIGLPQGGERIIEPYVTTRERGTGLGLAIVKKIVEEHSGDIAFASVPDGGTRATLRFARDPMAAAGSEAAE